MKIAILTNFMDFNPGNSLTGIAADQVRMLSRYGHEVHFFVNERCNGETNVFDGLAAVRPEIPFTHLIDYESKRDITDEHMLIAGKTASVLDPAEFDVIYTHDFIFQGWFLPYAVGCLEASKKLPAVPWMHWIHSIPSRMRDWWQVRQFGPQHTLVYPNRTDLIIPAEQYRGALEDCRCIPHIKDLRSWGDFCPETCEIIERMPGLMQADIVQILPASVDRLAAKRVKHVMQMFHRFKLRGRSVALFIANQWATTKSHKENVAEYMAFAESLGLTDREILFSSMIKPEYEVGLSRRVIRELFSLSNLFIFPTDHETFGLVMPEAALSGAFLVTNNSLDMTREVTGNTALGFDFGSIRRRFAPPDTEKYLADVADVILGRMAQNEAVATKTYARQRYNWDYLYQHAYAPVMAELIQKAEGRRLKAEGKDDASLC